MPDSKENKQADAGTVVAFCALCNFSWAMAKNGSSRCLLAKNGCTLKTIAAAENVVGRI